LKEAEGGDGCMQYTTSLNKRENYLIKYWTLFAMVPVGQYGTRPKIATFITQLLNCFPVQILACMLEGLNDMQKLERDFDTYSVRIYLVTMVVILIH